MKISAIAWGLGALLFPFAGREATSIVWRSGDPFLAVVTGLCFLAAFVAALGFAAEAAGLMETKIDIEVR